MPSSTPTPAARLPGLELLAGWAIPGLGHYLAGQRRRGLVLGLTILTLWGMGLLISGLGAIDLRRHTLWFYGQVLAGPTLVVEVANRQLGDMLERPGAQPRDGATGIEPAYGRPDEQGVLYTALAGLLNLLVLVDLATGDRRSAAGPAVTGPASRESATTAASGDAAAGPTTPSGADHARTPGGGNP